MNPLLQLSPALYAKLTSPALTVAGVAVPVWRHLPLPEPGHYVHLQQPTLAALPGATGCKVWSCTTLVDVITQFQPGYVSDAPVNELIEQITNRLDGQRLALTGYDCGPATYDPSQPLEEADGELIAVRQLLRFRWAVYQHS